ncbi:MAG TPA: DUF1778 domain-containing protein [Pedobacter sp.]|jgi:uncharacterized protein (DUF1778 family)
MAVTRTKGTNEKSVAEMKDTSQTTMSQSREQSRMNIRLAPAIKERVARAATLSGQDLTEFAVATLSEKADLAIERHDHLLLGSEEHEFFLNALAEPIIQELSERSRSAAEKYRQGSRKGVRHTLAD